MHGQFRDVAAFKDDMAGARDEPAGNHVEERRLAGAIGADETGDKAAMYLEADIIDGDKAAEMHRYAIEGDHRSFFCELTSSSRRKPGPMNPPIWFLITCSLKDGPRL